MVEESTEEITQKTVYSVQEFFNRHMDDNQAVFPDVLGYSGVWMAICADGALGVFFLSEAEQQRINACREQGVHPFPGFMIGERERPQSLRATYNVTSPFRFYSEKKSGDTFAFSVGPEASCVVLEHSHEITDKSEKNVSYTVDLAFLLGHEEGEAWPDVEARLQSLLEYSLEVWKAV